jgi:hypothetical protein
MNSATILRARDRGKLLAWAKRQQSAPLSAAQAAALDSIYPEWRTTTHNGVWYTKLEAVEAFFEKHSRFPKVKTDDPGEKTVGIWLATQRQRVDRMSAERRKVIDERLPGWCLSVPGQTRDTRWESQLEALATFHKDNGRVPVQKADDPVEAKLAAWLATQRKTTETLSAARVQKLDTWYPAWRETRDDIWKEHLHVVAGYLREHHYFPKSSKDPAVRKMASWLSAQRAAHLSAERLAALNEHIPLWRNRSTAVWQRKLDLAAGHLATAGRLPRTASSDAAEAKLGFWLGYQRKHATKLSDDQRRALDKRLPGWGSGSNSREIDRSHGLRLAA